MAHVLVSRLAIAMMILSVVIGSNTSAPPTVAVGVAASGPVSSRS